MKKRLSVLMLFVALFVPWVVTAQSLENYGFTTGVDSTKWVDMTGATQILTPSNNDGLASSVQTIGFTFPFGASTYTQYSVNTDGNLRLGATVTGTANYSTPFGSSAANQNNPKINAFGCDGYGVTGAHYVKAKLHETIDGDSLLAVEFCMGTFTSNTRSELYKWQIHLYANGNIDIVFPTASDLPGAAPAVAHQCGICASSSDGWIISAATNTAMHFTAGSSVTNATGTWFDANRYYTFIHPSNINCPGPTGITASNITPDGATISWTAGGTESAWELTIGDDTYYPTDTFYTLTNLEGNTPYTVSVRAICGYDDTSFASSGSFRTACVAISQLPYFNDFENEPYYLSGVTTYAEALPNCWARINDASGTYNYYPYISTTSTYLIHGGKSMYWYHATSATYADNQYAILPPIDLDVYNISDLTLTFYAKTTATAAPYPQFITGVMTDPTDATTFTPLDTVTLTTTPTLYVVSLADYTDTGAYIAIRSPRTSTSTAKYASLDDIYLTDAFCDVPESVAATATLDEITLSWDANGGTSFTVVLGADTISNVTDTFYTFQNLTANTAYTYAVATECTDGLSLYVGGSIRTLCAAIDSLPYSYGFEDLATGSSTVVPNIPCWHHINNATQYFGYPYVTSTSHTGSRGLYWYGSTTATTYSDYQIVVLPAVDTNIYPINTLKLNFWARPSSTSYYPVFLVGVMTDPNDASTFQLVQTVNVQNVTTWQEFNVMFGNYTGSGNFIAVRLNRPSSSYYAYTDDFTLDVMPSCPNVNSHHVTATAGAASITWAVEPGFSTSPDSYEVSYGFASGTPTVVTTTTPELLLTGLVADSTYAVSISSVCDGIAGVPHTFTFTTQALPCLEWDTTAVGGNSSPTATYVVGTPGTSTTNVMPVNGAYNYSYCNHLILRSDISSVPSGTTYFSGIDFQYAGTAPMTSKTNCAIYMCHTTMTVCDNFANPADLVLVYEGPLNCTTPNAWNHFEFNRGTFAYNGTSNIIVAIVDNSGAHNANDIFYYENIGTSRSHRVYRDDAPYTFAELGTVTAGNSVWRTNMHLTTGGNGGGTCLTQASCAAPAVTIEQDANGDYALTWIPGYQETSWDVDYRATDTTAWTSAIAGTSQTNYTFLLSDLQPNTEYEFRVTANCTDTNISTTVSITTPCGLFSVPFTEDFETFPTAAATPLPNCWTKHTNYTTNYPYASTSYHHSGSRAMYMYSSSGTYSYLVLPQFDVPIDSTMLTFWLYKTNTSYPHALQVGVMTNPDDLSTFTMVAEVSPSTTSAWEQFEVSLAAYNGTGRNIAFLSPSNNYCYPYLDDLEVSRLSACSRVTDLRATNVLTTSATINWYDTNSTYTAWYVEYDTVEFTPGTNHMTPIMVTDSNCTITGLDSGMTYYVYVYPDCIEVSPRGMRFTTLAASPSTVPYFCDFENSGVNGWDLYNDNQANYWMVGNNVASAGSRSLYITNNGSTNDYTVSSISYSYAVRTFQLVDTGDYAYSFDWKCNGEGNYDFIRVLFVNASTDVLAGTPLFGSSAYNFGQTVAPAPWIDLTGKTTTPYGLNVQTTWQNRSGVMRINTPGTYKMVIAWVNDGSGGTTPPGAIDNVALMLNTCNMVQNVVTSATDNTIDATWTAGGLETEWEVDLNGVATVVTTPAFNATGLTPNTNYTLAIRAICSTTDTGMAYVENIRTACAVESVPYFEDFESYTSGSTNPISPCWVKHVIGTTTQYPYPYSTNAVSGNISLYFYSYHPSSASTTPYHCYAALPLFNVPVNNLEVSFKMRRYATVSDYYTSIIVVGVMTNPNDISTFTPVDTIDLHSEPASSIHEIVVSLNSYTGNGNYIALYAPVPPLYGSGTYSYSYSYVDDVAVSYASACPRAFNPTAYDGTANSVTLEWSDTIGSTSWVIEYGVLGDTNTTTVTVTSNPYTLTGLTPHTNYRYHVASICPDGQQADWSLRWCKFSTAHNPATVPYSYDFENAAEWDNWQTNSNNTVNWYRGDVATGNTTNALYLSTDNGATHSWNMNLITNAVAYRDIDFGPVAGAYQVDFDAYIGGTTSANYDGISVVVADPAVYVEGSNTGIVSPWGNVNTVGYGTVRHDTVWGHHTIYIDSVVGVKRIAFYHFNQATGASYAYENNPSAIDNVAITQQLCDRPFDLTVVSATTSSVTLSWSGDDTATYQVAYRVQGAAASTNAYTVVNGTTTTINGLPASTKYYWWVRKICTLTATDTIVSGFSNTGAFSTLCGVVSVADTLFEDFESYTGVAYNTNGVLPNCWEGYNASNTLTPHITNGSTYSYCISGTNAVTMTSGTSSGYTGGTDNYMRLVDIAEPTNTLTIAYWMCTESSSSGYLEVGYLTGINYATDFVPVKRINASSNTIHSGNGLQSGHGVFDTVSFDSVPAGNFPICFHWNYTTSYYSVCLDDIAVWSSAVSCNPPVIDYDTVGENFATVGWNGVNNQYEVAIVQGNWVEPTNTTLVSGNTYTFTGLTDMTHYIVGVRAVCGASYFSNWDTISVTTLRHPCAVPGTPQVSGNTYDGATVTWTAGENETEWELKVFCNSPVYEHTYTVSDTPSQVVSGLDAATTYSVTVRAVCDSAWYSVWGDTVDLTTLTCPVVTGVTSSNVTATGATISWNSTNAVKYEIEYGEMGFQTGTGNTVVTTNTTITLNNLEEQSTYDVFVRGYCTEDVAADWSERYRFNTPAAGNGIADVENSNVTLYPNPASSMVTIGGLEGESTVTVVDLNGREVYRDHTGANGHSGQATATGSVTIDVSGYAKGAYFVRVTGESTTAIRKLIVK